jgi:putative tricarboxylic transport membrane protein
MKKANIVTSLILFLLSGYFAVESRKLPMSDGLSPGAGFLPFWIGVFMGGLSILLFIQSIRMDPSTGKRVFLKKDQGLRDIVWITSSLFAYCGCILLIGYPISTFLFLLFLLKVVGRYGYKISLGISAGLTAALYGIFESWLDMAFPAGVVRFF